MQPAIILQMSQEEKQDTVDERHGGSQRDIKDIKYQVDKLTGKVGEMMIEVGKLTTAFTGNDLGTEGLIEQMRRVVTEQIALKKRLDDLEMTTAKKQMYLLAFVGTLGIVVGTLITEIIKSIFKTKTN